MAESFLFLFNVFTFFFHRFYAESLKGKVVLITGASSGIGEQLAYAYGKRGALLVLVARREAALYQVAETARRMGSPDNLVAPADISNPEECRQVVEKAVTRFGKLNHLVTNAGMVTFCPFEEAGDITRFTRIMDVNFWGPYTQHTTQFHTSERAVVRSLLSAQSQVKFHCPVSPSTLGVKLQ